jgi:hypothetical protein
MKKYLILLFGFLACTGCESVFDDKPATDAPAVFGQVWNEFNHFYAPFAERNVDWLAVRSDYESRLSHTSTSEDLYRVLTEMLATLDDGHVQLSAPGKEVFYANRIYREKIDYDLFDKEVIKRRYLQQTEERPKDDGYLKGVIANDILYVHFPSIGYSMEKLPDWQTKMPDSRGLIIDLRHNLGGDFTYALQAFSHLADQRRLAFQSRTKNGPGRNDFTGWHDWYVEPKGAGYKKPIVVLTDRFTISAAERATMALAVLPNVTVLGETTNGSTSTMMAREMANGWHYSLATQQVLFADGKSYEGAGLPPASVVKNSKADLQNDIDRVLEKAIETLSR